MMGPFNKESTQQPINPPGASSSTTAIHELSHGHNKLAQLVNTLKERSFVEEELVKLAEDAMVAVSDALSLLKEGKVRDASVRMGAKLASQSFDEVTSEKSMAKTKSKLPKVEKTIRRRSRSHPYVCVRSNTLDDGFSWRKYGQKDIQTQSHRPRSYFRCTHKPNGCQAIRQAQRSQEDPSIYMITYIGQHTCKDAYNNPTKSENRLLNPTRHDNLTGFVPPLATTLSVPKQESDMKVLDTMSHHPFFGLDTKDVSSEFGSSISSIGLDDDFMASFFDDQMPCFDPDGSLSL